MTPDEHYRRAEPLFDLASMFEKRLYESTVTTPGAEKPRRAPVPLAVVNYVEFLQRQGTGHAALAQTSAPSVWGGQSLNEKRLPQDPGNENIMSRRRRLYKMTVEPLAGEPISNFINTMVFLARDERCTVTGTHNGRTLVAYPETTAEQLYEDLKAWEGVGSGE